MIIQSECSDERRAELRRLLRGYRRNWRQPLEFFPQWQPFTGYKMFILERFLQDGRVDTDEVFREIRQRDGYISPYLFGQAEQIIRDTVTTECAHSPGEVHFPHRRRS